MSVNTRIDDLEQIVCDHNLNINTALSYCFDYCEDNSEEIEIYLLKIKNDKFIIDKAIEEIKKAVGYYTEVEE